MHNAYTRLILSWKWIEGASAMDDVYTTMYLMHATFISASNQPSQFFSMMQFLNQLQRYVMCVQGMSTKGHQWKVMLDAAAFAPTQPLDLTEFPADFVAVSFYKMFGFPTGLGALLVCCAAAFCITHQVLCNCTCSYSCRDLSFL